MGRIVEGMFGMSPFQVQQQQNTQQNDTAMRYAQMTPQQQGTYGMARAGGMLAGAAAPMLGMTNPAMDQAASSEQIQLNADHSTPQGLMDAAVAAQKAGNTQLMHTYFNAAQQMKAAQVDAALKKAQLDKANRPEDKSTNEMRNAMFAATAQGLKPGDEKYDETVAAEFKRLTAPKQSPSAFMQALNASNLSDAEKQEKISEFLRDQVTSATGGSGNRTSSDPSQYDPELIKNMAREAIDNPGVLNGMARQKGLLLAVRNEMYKLGKTPEEIAQRSIEFQGNKAEQRILGARSAAIKLASTEALKMMDIVSANSKLISPTNYPSVNAVKNAIARGTGDTSIVKLDTSINALVNTYSRAVNPTGVGTKSDKDHAREIIDKGLSEGQMQAALDTLVEEMNAANASPGAVRKQIRDDKIGAPTETTPVFPTAPPANRMNQFRVIR